MLVGALAQYFFGITIFITSVFLVLLVLVQRGRGGGLTGALGGPGGQSAFGTKAGDLFTRITIVAAAVWIFLCASAVFFLNPALPPGGGFGVTSTDDSGVVEAIPGAGGSSEKSADKAAEKEPAKSSASEGTTPKQETPAPGAGGTAEVDGSTNTAPLSTAPKTEAPAGAPADAPASNTEAKTADPK